MAIFLVALMVIVVITLEFLRYRKAERTVSPQEQPSIVTDIDGVKLPQSLAYHPCHLWVQEVDSTTVRVGIDDLGRRLIGQKVDRITLPMAGKNLQQGSSIVFVRTGTRKTTLVAPVSGKVVEVNSALRDDPGIIHRDPYGQGWLFKIEAKNIGDQLSGLLAGFAASEWMKSAVSHLRGTFSRSGFTTAQDGGRIIDDVAGLLNSDKWTEAVRQFLGTEAITGIEGSAVDEPRSPQQ